MAIFSAILLMILLCAVVHIIRLRRQMALIRKQLDARLQSESLPLLSLQFVDRQLNQLASSINDTLLYFQSTLNESQRNDQVIREMLAGVSHDLRTPLTAIKGNTQLLLDSDLTVEQSKICRTILKYTDSMGQLSEHFWEYAYHTVSDVAPKLEKISITNLVSESIATLVPAFEENGLEVEFGESPQLYVQADREFGERIVHNLLRNCIKYSAGTIKTTIYSEGKCVVLSFSNPLRSGANIDVNRLFDKFYSAEQSGTRAAGLGLYLVHLFIEKMGGSVGASQHGNNLTVWVSFLSF